MSTWDRFILTEEANVDFLDDLNDLEPEEAVQAVRDAVLLAAGETTPTGEELANGRAAATIAAMWAGAPFSAGDVVDSYPFIREVDAEVDEKLAEAAAGLLEAVEGDDEDFADIDQFIEALS
ncbi:DUF4259 domain-containing protein [Corynebacterium liangguodongii]|uniref:Uncharacterized protein n=1 Tax=Corynebacterium liangguodongii TaxID=2079535 RepID=A0A2S0WCZ1_9CORY|nr:hypothetical protein [Corynebacterium liangguodongii]AWB83542.1 hypothetical protein C3E79_02740 [Corynebacterium liangguodongii]PWC00368.1 hypothetical protein DF219_00215 [Corynebacterium liangguodongii]